MNIAEFVDSTIFIVDDQPQNLDFVKIALEGLGAQIRIAINGEQALERLAHFTPDLILLDVMMPGINGFETCRRIKENEATKDIPIIFMTALDDSVDELKGFELGAVDYITKPLMLGKVIARVRAHLLIQRQRRQLAELNATKDSFFSIIAHDLRTPFISLISFLNLMKEPSIGADPNALQSYLSHLKDTVNNTGRLLENLLEWAQLQQKKIVFAPQSIDLSDVVNANIYLYQASATQKSIQLVNQISPQIMIWADAQMVGTIVRNLINNAIKFSNPNGVVTIRHQIVDERYIEVSVSDTGIGMNEIVRGKLFKLEHKLRIPGTANEKGTGLGLILCKEFVEKHGGKIWVESEVSKGSTFTFSIPRSGE